MSKFWFNFSLLALIWSIYYLAKRTTGGLLNRADVIIGGIVVAFCIGNIALYAYKSWQTRNK